MMSAIDSATDMHGASSGYDRFRADTYALLGSLLAAPPDQRMLDWLAGLESDEANGARMSEGWRALRAGAAEATAGELLDEFQNLFIGLGKGEIVPYGSWYKTGYLMEQPLVELRTDLRALGLEADQDSHEPEDHIAMLCQVMALLSRPGEGFGATEQRQFFERHMKDWCGRFFNDLRACPSARFYRAVGTFGAIFAGIEALRLEG